jgi:phage terminase large subunit-like protein
MLTETVILLVLYNNKIEMIAQQLKQYAIQALHHYLPGQRDKLDRIDGRLGEYYNDILNHCSAAKGDPNDWYNVYELLGAVRFLRMLRDYPFNYDRVRTVIRLGEGEWTRGKDGWWVHQRGGIVQPGTARDQVYRWEPFQVLLLAEIYGPMAWIPTEDHEGDRALLPTERVGEGGMIEDLRRLCTDYTFYAARKNNKTGLAAFIQLEFFLLEDKNAEIYCCANSAEQSKTLYNRVKSFVRQLDGDGHRFRVNQTICDWKEQYQSVRHSFIKPLSAGGKTKDGAFAQLVCADEFGSATWIGGKSDMKSLVDTMVSSMGARREPLTLTTTTAGNIQEGPFKEKLNALHLLLEREVDYYLGNATPTVTLDRTSCLLLEPDSWDRDEETLLTAHNVRHKVNRMLGRIVQHSFYDEWATKVRLNPDDFNEYCSKLMNVYKSAAVKEWVTPDRVRRLAVKGQRVDDCKAADGWIVFDGLDFSMGNDLHAMSYLCYHNSDDPADRYFFADCDAWITEANMINHPMASLFAEWVRDGWLHVSPGETLDPNLPVARIADLYQAGIYLAMFLYDPYKAKTPINTLAAFLYNRGADPKQIVMPCRQNYATFNPVVMEMDYMIKNDPPLIRFSASPLWPWCFGNAVLDTSNDGMENHKPIKRDRNSKIDPVIALLEGLVGFDIANGKVNEVKQL